MVSLVPGDGGTLSTAAPDAQPVNAAQGDAAPVGPPTDAGSGAPPNCVTATAAAEPEPLGIYMMVDQSSSMAGGSWDSVVAGLVQFLGDPSSEGLSVGIQYFSLSPPFQLGLPIPIPGFGTECRGSEYAVPDVPIDRLPDNSPAIIESLGTHGPSFFSRYLSATEFLSESPTDAALEGAIQGADAWSAANGDALAAVLLVTDGVPGADLTQTCNPTLDNTVAIARAGYEGAPSISTYVLGVGDNLDSLNQIAEAGGSTNAHIVSSSGSTDVLTALNAIRDVALPCEFPLPGTQTFATDEVNLVFVGSNTTRQTLPHVASVDDCTTVDGGWYYDDAAAPMSLVLCEASCTAAGGDALATLQIEFGCRTVTR